MSNSDNDEKFTLGFYNLENLFDINDDALTNDNDFLPESRKRWTQKRYDRKILKLGNAISQIGKNETERSPIIVGLAEVENRDVVQDLIKSEDLKSTNYDIVHYESSDERGIDVAMIYDASVFEVDYSDTFTVYLEDEEGKRDYTRDILLVSGRLKGEQLFILINHWPSRRDGANESNIKRMKAANRVIEIVQNLKEKHSDPKIIIMGDFNDNPNNESVKHLVSSENLYNPMETVWSYDKGSLNHDFKWNLFDQIFCSINLLHSNTNKLRYQKADVFNEKFLTQFKGKWKGQPFRTYVGKKYKGGFSDHFPVYMILEK